MADEVRDVLIRLRTDASGVQQGNAVAARSFTELNQAVEFGKNLAAGFSNAFSLLNATIDRGQSVSELSAAFENLQKQAGMTATAGINTLREATQGLVSDVDLMRASNQALLSGLTPDQFRTVAAAADTLGDALEIGTVDAMNQLSAALATGNERLVKQFGIMIDNKKAEEEYARSIGKSADQLSETGKREAARIAILAEMEKKTKDLGGASETAGDVLQKLGVTFTNSIDAVANLVNKSELLIAALQNVATFADSARASIRYLFSDDYEAQAARVVATLNGLKEAAAKSGGSTFEMAFSGFARGEEGKARIAQLEQEYKRLTDLAQKFKEENQKVNPPLRKSAEDAGLLASNTQKAKENIEQMRDSLPDFLGLNNLGFNLSSGMLGDSIDDLFGGNLGASIEKMAEELRDANKQAYRDSVDFFADIFTTTITGSSQSMEDILKDALKRVAIGFAAEMAASVASSMGLTSIAGSLGSAQGLGEALAQGLMSVFSGGGGSSGLFGDIAGMTSAASSITELSSASTAAAGSLAAISTAALPIIAAVVGVGATGYGVFETVEAIKAGNRDRAAVSAAATTAIPSPDPVSMGINAFMAFVGADLIGGNPQLAIERKNRENALGALQETGLGEGLTFAGVRGPLSLSAGNFNIDTSGLGGQAVGLANPFAQILSGGDDKLGADLAAIFANATSSGENFNEVLLNTQSLMDGLGFTAEDAKNQVRELFLDSQISLEEFGAGLDNLNILAQNDLIGPDSISDALRILAQNIKKDPRLALQALGLEFKELKDIGIDTPAEISAYFTERFGPDVASVFSQIGQVAGMTFEEITNSGTDELRVIFNLLNSIADELGDAFNVSANDAASAVERTAGRINRALRSIGEESNRTTTRMRDALSGGDDNPRLSDYRR